MKTQMKIMVVLLIAAFSIGSAGIYAQKTEKEVSKKEKKEHTKSDHTVAPLTPAPPFPPALDADDEDVPPPMLPVPDLTTDQKNLIHKANLIQLEKMTPLRNQVKEKIARLNTVLTTQPVNRKEADKIADEIGQLHASVLKLKISHDQDLRAILTPDQQIIFDAKPKPFLRRGGR